jgi:hypothetical protein
MFSMTLAGCAGKPVTWVSTPAAETVQTPAYEATLEPVTQGNPFYSAFRLRLVNTGKSPLVIDWNRCRYLFNNKSGGGLWFKGVAPEDLKNRTIPLGRIDAGSSLEKIVAPMKLMAIAPYQRTAGTKPEASFSAGQLPAGSNGIYLMVLEGGNPRPQQITVMITADETP